MKIQKIEELIIDTLQELYEAFEGRIVEPHSPRTKIFGQDGLLDSLGLVSLIVDLEERIEKKIGISLTLANERAISQKSSPFRTVSTLAEYICGLIEEEDQKSK